MSKELLKVPDWPVLPGEPFGKTLMSNFDHDVDQEVAQQLRDGQVMVKYPGWNFFAACWFADEQFHAGVYVLDDHRATISASTPEELMAAVSDEFGEE